MGITLSEISQKEKDKYRMISIMWNIKNNKTNKQKFIDMMEIGLVITREVS